MIDFSRISRVPLLLSAFLLVAVLPAGCSPSPRVMMEKYLEEKHDLDTSTIEATPEILSGCPEVLSGWLVDDQVTGRSWLNNGTVRTLATYDVEGDSMTLVGKPTAPEVYKTWQEDDVLQQQTWNYLTNIIPAAYREEVTRLVFFSDGPDGALGGVGQNYQPDDWSIVLDIQDVVELPSLAATLIHETAHLLSLAPTQVETYLPLFKDRFDEALFEQGKAACDTYFVSEGCSLPDSYLAQFFETYWTGLMDEWTGIQREKKDVDKYTRLLAKLYDHHADEFVSSYAVTSPEEDLAESFLYYVLSPEPTGETVAENKILFFKQFPELVILRRQIRINLCTILEP